MDPMQCCSGDILNIFDPNNVLVRRSGGEKFFFLINNGFFCLLFILFFFCVKELLIMVGLCSLGLLCIFVFLYLSGLCVVVRLVALLVFVFWCMMKVILSA